VPQDVMRRTKSLVRLIIGRDVPVHFYDERRIDDFVDVLVKVYELYGSLSMVDREALKRGLLEGGEYVVLDLPVYHVFLKSGSDRYTLMHALGHIAQVERFRFVVGAEARGAVTPTRFMYAQALSNVLNNIIVDYYVYGVLLRRAPSRARAYREAMLRDEAPSIKRLAEAALASGETDLFHVFDHLLGVYEGTELSRRERAALEQLARTGDRRAAEAAARALLEAVRLLSGYPGLRYTVKPHPVRAGLRVYTPILTW